MGVNRHPFVKDKWDERAYFLVQDVLYEGMDDGHVSVNMGISDLGFVGTTRKILIGHLDSQGVPPGVS